MNLPRGTRIVLGAAVLLAVLVYLVIFEMGLSAGRVHSGVMVRDVDVGGLTRAEAEDRLNIRGREMLKEPIVFTTEGVNCVTTRKKLGWGPQPADTAERAMRVGRDDVPFGALVDRFRAWFGGVTVDWDDTPDPSRVEAFVSDCQEQSDDLGLNVVMSRELFEEAVERAVYQWPPQQIQEIPLEQG